MISMRLTAKELMDRGVWQEYCDLTGTNEWAISEGLMDSSETLTVDHALAYALGMTDVEPPEDEDPLEEMTESVEALADRIEFLVETLKCPENQAGDTVTIPKDSADDIVFILEGVLKTRT
jgi:hypothetical protein